MQRLLAVFLVALMGLSTWSDVHAQQGCAPLPSAAVAWFPMEGSLADAIGSGLATPVATSAYAASVVNLGLNQGQTDRVALTSLGTLEDGATIEFWLRASEGSSGFNQQPRIVAAFGTTTLGFANTDATDPTPHFELVGPSPRPTFVLPVMAGANVHIAVTTHPTSGTKIYVDGSQRSASSAVLDFLSLKIGGIGVAGVRTFAGVYDEITVYSRALDAGDIASISAAGSAGKCRGRGDFPPNSDSLLANGFEFPAEIGLSTDLVVFTDGVAGGAEIVDVDGLAGHTYEVNSSSSAVTLSIGSRNTVVGTATTPGVYSGLLQQRTAGVVTDQRTIQVSVLAPAPGMLVLHAEDFASLEQGQASFVVNDRTTAITAGTRVVAPSPVFSAFEVLARSDQGDRINITYRDLPLADGFSAGSLVLETDLVTAPVTSRTVSPLTCSLSGGATGSLTTLRDPEYYVDLEPVRGTVRFDIAGRRVSVELPLSGRLAINLGRHDVRFRGKPDCGFGVDFRESALTVANRRIVGITFALRAQVDFAAQQDFEIDGDTSWVQFNNTFRATYVLGDGFNVGLDRNVDSEFRRPTITVPDIGATSRVEVGVSANVSLEFEFGEDGRFTVFDFEPGVGVYAQITTPTQSLAPSYTGPVIGTYASLRFESDPLEYVAGLARLIRYFQDLDQSTIPSLGPFDNHEELPWSPEILAMIASCPSPCTTTSDVSGYVDTYQYSRFLRPTSVRLYLGPVPPSAQETLVYQKTVPIDGGGRASFSFRPAGIGSGERAVYARIDATGFPQFPDRPFVGPYSNWPRISLTLPDVSPLLLFSPAGGAISVPAGGSASVTISPVGGSGSATSTYTCSGTGLNLTDGSGTFVGATTQARTVLITCSSLGVARTLSCPWQRGGVAQTPADYSVNCESGTAVPPALSYSPPTGNVIDLNNGTGSVTVSPVGGSGSGSAAITVLDSCSINGGSGVFSAPTGAWSFLPNSSPQVLSATCARGANTVTGTLNCLERPAGQSSTTRSWTLSCPANAIPLTITSVWPTATTTSVENLELQETVHGSGFSTINRIELTWSGSTSGNAIWVPGDSNWQSKVSIDSDGQVRIRPRVTLFGEPAGTSNWVVRFSRPDGAQATWNFSVTFASPGPSITLVNPNSVTAISRPAWAIIDLNGANLAGVDRIELNWSGAVGPGSTSWSRSNTTQWAEKVLSQSSGLLRIRPQVLAGTDPPGSSLWTVRACIAATNTCAQGSFTVIGQF